MKYLLFAALATSLLLSCQKNDAPAVLTAADDATTCEILHKRLPTVDCAEVLVVSEEQMLQDFGLDELPQ